MLSTAEGRKVTPDNVLQDYPYPQFQRDSFFCLNGQWEFEITDSPAVPSFYSKVITVPFAVETPLSGIGIVPSKDDYLHYRKKFTLPEGFNIGRVLIHFEAVDQIADVYLNGVRIAHHEGGYEPFVVDCLELIPGENELCVVVKDDTTSPVFPRGKQSLKSSGIWYTSTSGIWGTVWLESVPKDVIQSIRLTPLFDEKSIKVEVQFEGKIDIAEVEVFFAKRSIAIASLIDGQAVISLANCFYPWEPKMPNLYHIDIKVNKDVVHSYFAMRKFSVTKKNGHPYFALNNEPLFLSGVLDQGYYPESGLTPPTDQAMINDIQMVKEMGFNMIRKHIKIEPMRWYYHCDVEGMIVIQDMLNAGAPYKPWLIMAAPFFNLKYEDTSAKSHNRFGRGDPNSRVKFEHDLRSMINRLYNCPCIAIWTLFNEGWGQFDSVRLSETVKTLDDTRLLDSTSGWYDQGAGDFSSHHVYFRKVKLQPEENRILSLSEFGGYAYSMEDHIYAPRSKFGYKNFRSMKKLTEGVKKLYEAEIIPLSYQGLSVAVYTQLSDVENELNGLTTYDRFAVKVDPKVMASLNKRLIDHE